MAGTVDQDIRLTEYAALRAEISQRSSFQQALLALNLTAIATVIGFALPRKSSDGLLLLVPVISSVLGLLWLDHHRNIRLLATYIRNELWGARRPSWESWFGEHRSGPKDAMYWFAIALVFGVPSVAPLAIAWPGRATAAGVSVLAGTGVALALLLVVAYVAVVVTEWRGTYRR